MSEQEFCDMLRNSICEERERAIEEMSEDEVKSLFKSMLRVMFRIKDAQDAGIKDRWWF